MTSHPTVRMTRALSAFTLVVGSLLCTPPSRLSACGGIAPAWTLLTTESGSVLEGTRVLKIYQYVAFEKTTYTLRAQKPLTPETVVPITVRKTAATWLVELDLGDQPIESSTQYTLEVSATTGESSGGSASTMIKFDGVNSSYLPPNTLGTLQLERRDVGRINLGGCGSGRDGVQAVLALNGSPEAAPWERQAEHQLLVDGKPAIEPELPRIDYVAMVKPLKVRAMAFCSDKDYGGGDLFVNAIDVPLEAGVHEVRWRTRYPDGRELTSNALHVDLRCDVPAAGEARDAGAPSRPVGEADAGQGQASVDAANAESDATHAASCSAVPALQSGHARGGWSTLLGLVIAFGALGRRRIAVG